MSVLFVGKGNDSFCEQAVNFVTTNFSQPAVILGQRGDTFPEDYYRWRGDYIVSYLSPWIIPQSLLEQPRIAALNFHPGPPEYPGIGCTNFAIYNNEKTYGVTCHHMAAKVDTGNIIAVRRFPLFPGESVLSLTLRSYAYLLALFYDVISCIMAGQTLPASDETWKRRPYRRSELNDLCKLTLSMGPEEMSKRIRATTFPGKPGAYLDIGGLRFIHQEQDNL